MCTAWRRPQYLAEVLDSWRRVDGIEEATMRFHIEPGCDEVLQLVKGVDFCSRSWVVNDRVYGPLTNPWRALEDGFQRREFVILAEEDSVVSPDILRAFEWVDGWARGMDEVLAVCAFQERAGEDPALWRLQKKFHATVWATWDDRWRARLRDSWDHTYAHRGWDWHINNAIVGDGYVVAPEVSRSQHIGRDGGAHCTREMFESLRAPTFAGPFEGGYCVGASPASGENPVAGASPTT